MKIDLILGNKKFKEIFKLAHAAKKLPHALIVVAEDGCGRGFASRCIAADYLFPQGGSGADAVMDTRCSEMIIVEGEGRSGQITVDRIRQMRSDIFLSAISAAGRVVWIKDAHKMAAAPANALLKVLEEPPTDVLFILSCHSAEALPVTIRSRCALYALQPLSRQMCEEQLSLNKSPDTDSKLPQLLAQLYGGRLGMGLKVMADQKRQSVMYDSIRLVKAAVSENRYEMLRIFSGYEGRKDIDRPKRADLIADCIALCVVMMNGEDIEAMTQTPLPVLTRIIPLFIGAQTDLNANVSPKLLFAALTVKLAAVSAAAKGQTNN